ncbi:MAG: NYN domain-containing protein [Longimicrobiaceae bacterium]
MNVPQAHRVPHRGTHYEAPNAALLIDFDNVTMAIRSDLGKELKSLLGSDLIRGKVAVQRAYADWRRYPQYIVPLSESSIDLIFAPAYGSSKKNATDLRMAIDAIELVFTRPEIGTYILLTGDSDFSSCVLKLKEYGKYVIGVGMKESSSDLLIQNCDEYYSYHSISGLTATTEATAPSGEDPWSLAGRAAKRMTENRDVMRTDRLKQVMLEMDASFNEKNLGYSKFSRFVQEAASKGLFKLRKMENGQYELAAAGRSPGPVPPPEPRREEPRPAPPAREQKGEPPAATLRRAYQLLQNAVRSVAGPEGGWTRDAEVKRKMLELESGFDEAALGFSKFSRFLRQAHDDEAVDVKQIGAGSYEVALNDARAPEQAKLEQVKPEPEQVKPEPKPSRPRARGRQGAGRGGEGPPPILPGQTVGAPQRELPGDAAAMRSYLMNSYKGVGARTADTLIEAFGKDLFRVLSEDPGRVRGLLGEGRARALLEQWSGDQPERPPADPEDAKASESESDAAPATPSGPPQGIGARRGRSRVRG